MKDKTFLVPNGNWLREYARNGGTLSGLDVVLVADIIEMLADPETALTMRGEASKWEYPEYRARSLLERTRAMFARLEEHRDDTDAVPVGADAPNGLRPPPQDSEASA